ncbi:CIA30 family protein [Neptunicella sp. SCSIO 80796]|uniref:CIA30 family protein n=1 Tax=Neptunicella plasticusilytica TaxID=3117012 RepID=UPI003A4DAC75
MMKTFNKTAIQLARACALTSLLAISNGVWSASLPQLVDDFSKPKVNSLGIERQFMSDTVAGGKTQLDSDVSAGMLNIKGNIVPPRGQPGWASSVLPLGAMGVPEDASEFTGIRLLVKINSGNMSISANSTEISNFDFHSAPVVVPADNQFHEVKIPFTAMQRGWSEQTPLNSATLNSLSIVAYAMQNAPFDFVIDEVGFY